MKFNYHEPTLNYLGRRKKAYNLVFNHDAAEHNIVMTDLAKFAGAFDDPVDINSTNMTYLKLGRKQVWDRIMEHLNFPLEELYKRYGGPRMPTEEQK